MSNETVEDIRADFERSVKELEFSDYGELPTLDIIVAHLRVGTFGTFLTPEEEKANESMLCKYPIENYTPNTKLNEIREEAKREGRRLELRVLQAHLDEQMGWYSTINKDTLYKYIEDATEQTYFTTKEGE